MHIFSNCLPRKCSFAKITTFTVHHAFPLMNDAYNVHNLHPLLSLFIPSHIYFIIIMLSSHHLLFLVFLVFSLLSALYHYHRLPCRHCRGSCAALCCPHFIHRPIELSESSRCDCPVHNTAAATHLAV